MIKKIEDVPTKCVACKEFHVGGCNPKTVAVLIDVAYWQGASDAGMDSDIAAAAIIKGENGELD